MNIPLVDLKAQYRAHPEEFNRAVQAVMERGDFILGSEVGAFEEEFAAFCQTRHAVGVATGTDALELSLRACGIGPGDEVITAANSFVASASSHSGRPRRLINRSSNCSASCRWTSCSNRW